MASPRPGSSSVDRLTEQSRSPSPIRIRRHRRSYTISAPLGTRVNAFPNPSSLPPTPPRKNSPSSDKENIPPPRCTSSNSAPLLNSKAKGKVPESPKRPHIFHTTSIFNDRFLDLPPLPDSWTTEHDRAICWLDSKNFSHPTIVAKMRRAYPGLRGTLTPLMIDKRLRILDQNVELDYWRINHRAHSTISKADELVYAMKEENAPTKASKKSRLMDAVMGRKSEPRAAARGLGMGFRGVFDRL
ncbi:hypothetical protein MBLNU13_g10968t2 [Cladosporium sp. NU13]